MARAPDPRIAQAEAMYREGKKLAEIANQLNLPEGTVRRWKSTKWNTERSLKNSERSLKNTERSERKKTVVKEATKAEIKQVMENPELSDKQRFFCLHYVRNFNAVKAYQKAYDCSYETAAVNGYRLLENASVKNEIKRLKQGRANRELLTQEDIFQKYIDIAFADMSDFVDYGREEVTVLGAFGPVEVQDEKTGKKKILTKEINTVRFKESAQVDGTLISEIKQGKDGASIKLADRMKALQWLSDHMDMATEEQRVRIESMRIRAQMGDEEEIADDGFLEALKGTAMEDWADEG